MAQVDVFQRQYPYVSTIVELINFGDGSPGVVSRKRFQLTGSGTWNGSLTVKGRKAGTSDAFIPIAYTDVTTGLNATAALSGINLAKIIEVISDGLDIALDHTAVSAGNVSIDCADMLG